MTERPISTRPTPLPVCETAIPDDLKALRQWVCWAYEYEPKRNPKKPWTKIPKQPSTGGNASSTNPRTWGSFKQAMARYQSQELDGVGVVLTDDDPYVAIDLDSCCDPETGEVAPWAQAIINRFASYTEVSPSGTGIRVFVRGHLPPGGRKQGAIETYETGRFMTVTGCHRTDTPTTIEERQDELETWHHEVFGKPPKTPISRRLTSANGDGGPQPLADDAIIEKALTASNGVKFTQLWAADTSGYPSQSEADSALCCMLASWTKDAAQLDRLFRRSGLMRDKWDEQHGADTYGGMTIQRALTLVTESYSGNGHKLGATTGPMQGHTTLPWIDASHTDLPVIADEAWQALLTANAPHASF